MCQKIFGYCRISTPKQNIERQVRNILNENPNAEIVREIYTGKNISRPEFDKLLTKIQSGDTIIFDSVSRLSRNAKEGFELYKKLFCKGVNLIFLRERHIDTNTYRRELAKQINIDADTNDTATNELLQSIANALNIYILHLAEQQIILAFQQSQKEVDDLRQRTKEGIETARRNGKKIGGQEGAKLHVKKKTPIKELIKKYSKNFEGNLKDSEVIAIINNSTGLHVSNNTYYKYKKSLKFAE